MTTPREMLEGIETATRVAPRNGGLELTEWENGFVASITEQLDNDRNLSPRQRESLEEIWDKT